MAADDPVSAEIGRRVSAKRRELRFTQAQLATALGVSGAQLSRWESGQYEWPASAVVAVAAALGCTSSQLMPDAPVLVGLTEGEGLLLDAVRKGNALAAFQVLTKLLAEHGAPATPPDFNLVSKDSRGTSTIRPVRRPKA